MMFSLRMRKSLSVFAILSVYTSKAQQSNVVSIPFSWTSLLPQPGFHSEYVNTFANGTTTTDKAVNAKLAQAATAPFISYDDEFLDLLGPDPKLEVVSTRKGTEYAFEAGIWIPERNQVWFCSHAAPPDSHIFVLDMKTNGVSRLKTTPAVINPNGGYYYDGTVYFATYQNNATGENKYQGGIVAIDVKTLKSKPVLNSYFGLPFSFPDDLVWVKRGGKSFMFFTDLGTAHQIYDGGLPTSSLPPSLWRYDPQDDILLSLTSPIDVAYPNGVRVSPDQKTLYLTDSGSLELGKGYPGIYKYDLDEEVLPVNKRNFAYPRYRFADGIHVDDAGRIWTGEGEGVVVRNAKGKMIGVFNGLWLLPQGEALDRPVANFALAGDRLVILAVDKIYTMKLGQVVVSRDSPIVN